jgi:kumamolisin
MAGRKVFTDSIVQLPPPDRVGHAGMIVQAAEPAHLDDNLELMFALQPPEGAEKQLEERVARGEVSDPAEIEALSAPDDAREKLTSWLTSHGFTVDHVSKDGTSVYATSTASNIADQLQVDMARVTRDGQTYTAARTDPSLPSEVGEGVRAIVGLQPFRHANRRFRRMPASAVAGTTTSLVPREGYTVPQIMKAYGAAGLTVTGAGQTIAILIDTAPLPSDVDAFWAANGLTGDSSRVEIVNVGGGQLPAQSGEETLDVEWASGIASGATVRVYCSGSLRFVALDRALDRIIEDLPANPGMRQLSMSLGLGETYFGGPKGEVAVQHLKFLKLAAAGVNVFVSSGDAGSNPDQTGHDTDGPTQAEYEASDPAVIGVGGTSLRLHRDGTVRSETAWAGSGGGQSIYFQRPSWQQAPGMPVGTARMVPDVSLVADPNTGGMVILHGQAQPVGGTSWSAPSWAALCALANEARTQKGQAPLGFLGPTLYSLASTPAFRDVTSGSNGAFKAGTGYDAVTGLGVPDVAKLIDALTAG